MLRLLWIIWQCHQEASGNSENPGHEHLRLVFRPSRLAQTPTVGSLRFRRNIFTLKNGIRILLAVLVDHQVCGPRESHEKLDAVHTDPVVHGMVQAPGEWAWSSGRFYYVEDDSILRMGRMNSGTTAVPFGSQTPNVRSLRQSAQATAKYTAGIGVRGILSPATESSELCGYCKRMSSLRRLAEAPLRPG